MKYKTFDEMPIWIESIEITKEIYKMLDLKQIKNEFFLKDQIKRSALSISANIAEGFERSYKKEFSRFLRIAKGSIGETKSHLLFMKELYSVEENMIKLLISRLEILSSQIGGLIKYLNTEYVIRNTK